MYNWNSLMVFSLWTLNLSLHGKHEPISHFFKYFFLASKLENPLKHFSHALNSREAGKKTLAASVKFIVIYAPLEPLLAFFIIYTRTLLFFFFNFISVKYKYVTKWLLLILFKQ